MGDVFRKHSIMAHLPLLTVASIKWPPVSKSEFQGCCRVESLRGAQLLRISLSPSGFKGICRETSKTPLLYPNESQSIIVSQG